jgi:hypothetical protein
MGPGGCGEPGREEAAARLAGALRGGSTEDDTRRLAEKLLAADEGGILPLALPVAGPRVAIVSSAELAAQPGAPLSADYWVNRLPGEPWTAYRVRRQIEALEAKAVTHEEAAARLREQAAQLRQAAGG